ncbi:hypothetical protein BD626DRAFT_399737 [Schizophyllum amplum]|uniref:FAD-binding PCMH-type domain-containing protein n=1 Tax=Schizophyllum amplum TaxID=97359 RepID=A0A550CJR2_9AGAR|nr:hypothetical protein BD626DRAFT_399737 [Auriculariopsis ampla]
MSSLPDFPFEFKGDIVTRSCPGYTQAIMRWARSAERNAAVVAFVKDAADTSIAIAYARENNLPIAIKCGGHSSAGASSVEDGLVIDCSRYLNYCRVDAAKKVAHVGGGTLWETVDKAAYEHGLATVAGVSVLTLGGGFGYLSGQHGLAADNVLEATVVVADGTTLVANSNKHSDLFFGIRGGGSNFGVVTEFIFRLHDQRPTIFGGFLGFSSSALSSLVKAAENYWAVQDPRACMFMTLGAKSGVRCLLFYDGSVREGRSYFKDFFDAGPTSNSTKEIPYVEANTMMNSNFRPGGCEYQKGIAHPVPDLQLLTELKQMIEAYGRSGGPSPVAMFSFWPKGRIMHPAEDCAFRRDPYPDLGLIATWQEITSDNFNIARKRVYELHDFVKAYDASHLSELSSSALTGYGNNGDEAASSALEARAQRSRLAFGDVYPRLQEIKKKYDPDMVFNRWYPIIPV